MYHHSSLDMTGEEFHPVALNSVQQHEIQVHLQTSLSLWITYEQARELVAALVEVIPAPATPAPMAGQTTVDEVLDGAE